ncbi:MAG: sulfite exporter TauE/SafE family protein [Sedimentisphaerales bacterium]|nr:sulfite exporter TauE/SafE family protein [Sedimentisphaerales bacterium]
MNHDIITLVGAVIIGAAASALTGLFGVGGGFLLTPMLHIVLGIPIEQAAPASLAGVAMSCMLGIYKRKGTGHIDYKLAGVILCGSLTGVLLGAGILQWLSDVEPLTINRRELRTVQFILLCIFAILLMVISGWIIYELRRTRGGGTDIQTGLLSHVRLPPMLSYNGLTPPERSLVILLAIGLALGILAGLLGIGGGVLFLPALIYLVGQQPQRAAGASLVIVALTAITGLVGFIIGGSLDILLWLALAIGSLIGVPLGVRIGKSLHDRCFKQYFAFVILAAAAMVMLKIMLLIFGSAEAMPT